MSISSIANPSNTYGYSLVLQQGLLTFVAGQTATVPCAGIKATSKVLLRIATQTGRTNPDEGLDGLFTVAITAGTGFTAVSLDVAYAGTVDYLVLDSSAPTVNITSA